MVPQARFYFVDVGTLWRYRVASPHFDPILHGQRPSFGSQEHHCRDRNDRIFLSVDLVHWLRSDGQWIDGPERQQHGCAVACQELFRVALCRRLGDCLYHGFRNCQRIDRCGWRMRRARLCGWDAWDATERSATDSGGKNRIDRHRCHRHLGRFGLRRNERDLFGRMGFCNRRVGEFARAADAVVLQRDDQTRDHHRGAPRDGQLGAMDRVVSRDV